MRFPAASALLPFIIIYLILAYRGEVNAIEPIEGPPSALVDQYSMHGAIPIEKFFVVEDGSHYKYSRVTIEKNIEQARRNLDLIANLLTPKESDMSEYNKDSKNQLAYFSLLPKQHWSTASIYLNKDAFKGATVAIFGSIDPYFESVSLALGAVRTVTFEYNELTFDHDAMSVVWGDEYYAMLDNSLNRDKRDNRDNGNKSMEEGSASSAKDKDKDEDEDANPNPIDASPIDYSSFDIVLSFSSFDHSGLGRYGDRLDPYADLSAVRFASSLLKPEGLMLLTVPIGPDVLVWNLHRRYGRKRLKLLLDIQNNGLREEMVLGWDGARMEKDASWRKTYEPVFVLRKKEKDQDQEQELEKGLELGIDYEL